MAVFTIGEAVKKLRGDFSDLSISKVRYLEERGLIDFKRSKGGYRKFDDESLARLREILRLQREHYYPLDVIKEKMKHWRGAEANAVERESAAESTPRELVAAVAALGLSGEEARGLESFGLIRPVEKNGGRYLSVADINIVKTYLELARFGIEPRHLRPFVGAADRQANLYQQVLTPVKGRASEARPDLERLVELGQRLTNYLCRRAVDSNHR